MKRLSVCIAFIFSSLCAFAQTGTVQGFCTQGAVPAVTSGSSSANTLQGVIAGCTVTVYLHGTTTLATIYKDANNTPLANPFTANLAGVTNAGGWLFYAATSQGVDIFGSGGGGNPSCTTQPKCYAVSTPLAVAVYPSTAITIVTGVLTAQGSSPVEVNGASGTPASGAVTISLPVADTSDNGYLSSTDWTTFNGKQPALSLIKGTYVDGDLCTYTSSGTLLNCNTMVSGSAAYVFITDPPYNAKCDGSTDDTVAIQAAYNSGAAEVDYPVSTGADQQQCNHAGTIQWPTNTALTVELNGTIDDYTGTGTSIDISNTNNPQMAMIENGQLAVSSTSGNPVAIAAASGSANMMLRYITFEGSDAGALGISLNGVDDVYLYGIYGNIPLVLGAATNANHLEFNCFNNTQTGLTIPASYISTFNGLSIAGCKYAVDLGSNGSVQQTVTINSGDFDTIATAIFNIEQPSTNLLFGSVQYNHTTGEIPLFSNANFQGNLQAYDFATQLITTYQTSNALQFGSSTRYATPGSPAATYYSDNQYSSVNLLMGADDFSSGTFASILAFGGYEPCAEPCTPLQDTVNDGGMSYEGAIDPSTGITSEQDLHLNVPNNIGNNIQLEIDDLGNVGIGGAGMTGGGDADNGDLFVDAGVGAVEKYSYAAPAFIANSGATVMDRCSGGSNDGAYVAAASTQATACTVGGGSLVNTGIETP